MVIMDMKKSVILLFVFLLLSFSLVKAEIILSDASSKYNLGDIAVVEGYVTSSNDLRNVLRIYLDCESSLQISAKMISVKANEKYSFKDDINLFGGKGICSFRATFNGESKKSNDFEITDELKGSTFVNDNGFKLGEVFELTGDVLTISSNKFNGIGIISFNRNDDSYLIDTFDILGGEIKYGVTLEKLPADTYTVKLEAFDFFGNQETFDLENIVITDKLPATLNLDKNEYLPGDKITVI